MRCLQKVLALQVVALKSMTGGPDDDSHAHMHVSEQRHHRVPAPQNSVGWERGVAALILPAEKLFVRSGVEITECEHIDALQHLAFLHCREGVNLDGAMPTNARASPTIYCNLGRLISHPKQCWCEPMLSHIQYLDSTQAHPPFPQENSPRLSLPPCQ